MSADILELQSFLDTELTFSNLASAILPDSSYSLPSRDWITTDLRDSVNKSIASAGIVYIREANDCDDFSLFNYWLVLTAVLIAKQRHSHTTPETTPTALAVGMLGYIKDNGQGHAIIISIIREPDHSLKALYTEPQSGLTVQLSDNEKSNALYLLM